MFPLLLWLRLSLTLLSLAHPPDGQVAMWDSAGRALLAHAAHVCGPLLAGEVHIVSEDLRCPPAESLHASAPSSSKRVVAPPMRSECAFPTNF